MLMVPSLSRLVQLLLEWLLEIAPAMFYSQRGEFFKGVRMRLKRKQKHAWKA
jgi:hypothetical protein